MRDIPDGATIGLSGGFAVVGVPINLYGAVAAQGAKGLTCVSNSTRGGATLPPEAPDMGQMIQNGQVKKVVCAFTAPTRASQRLILTEYVEKGLIEAELTPQGTLAERMRAAGAGIPAFYTPAAVGTELAEGRETRMFNGREYLLEHALPLDYAMIRAYQADAAGNLRFRRSQRNFNPIMAMAARVTVVEVEEDILPVGAIDPDDVHTPGIFVHRIVKISAATRGMVAATAAWSWGEYRTMSERAKGLSRQQMCDRLAMEFGDGWIVNLGIGIPTLCSNFDFGDKEIIFHSENGVIGYGPLALAGEEDLHLVNAGGQHVTLRPGAAIVHHADLFAMIRTGRIDVTVLGAYEVAENGDLANWKMAGQQGGGIGGAMDLAACAKHVFVAMEDDP